ncbi:rRNA-binding ribosome biosynthesis protein utp25 [Coemansia spiralis]|uniref:U3 small nucleolar RNA-associated protein 25 n=1 Tax=Coemansia spiralis TaxID=417178 RepID=A0A9W8G9H0_9FUNG|nr:rRNA-binding ribosome biosynthesis protein utp25 [Coemansia spiralis]
MPPSKKPRRPTRRELQQLKEYGELDPLSSMGGDNDLDVLIGNAISKSGSSRFSGSSLSTKPAATTKPSLALDSDEEEEKEEGEEEFVGAEDAEMEDEGDDDAIIGASVAASKRIQAEAATDGEDQGSDSEYEVDKVDNSELPEDEDEGDNDDNGDDDDDYSNTEQDSKTKEVYEGGDFMESHFADDDSESMHRKLAVATQKEYKTSMANDPMFGPMVLYNTSDEGLKEPNRRPLKQRLVKPFHKVNKGGDFTEFQRPFFSWLDQYRDVVFTARSSGREDEITTAYALHAMNHVMKARDRERKNNAKLAKAHASGKDVGELRDRGFTRPRVLILLPFRNSAYNVVKKLLKLASAEQELNSSRFEKEYGPSEDESNANKRKPADYQNTFAGNIDDAFRIGLQLHHRTVKLYSEFYRTDIIVASPIGLRMTTGAQSGDRKDYDFLSSIELVIVDQCDVLLMQNWDHVSHLFSCLNLTPKKDHGCDFSRVHNWALEGMAQYRRQTVMISEYMTPEIQAVFNNNCRSLEGKIRIKPVYHGTITNVVAQVPQIFKRVAVNRLASAADDRFAHFTENVLPELEKSIKNEKHTVIFTASYFDFVRLRNHLKDKGHAFVAISEYSTRSEAMRARIKFFEGEINFVLYNERAHFYHRYPIKGINNIVFYSLPDHSHYYSELVNLLLTSNDSTASADKLSCTVFYTKYDQLKVERIVGTNLASQLLSSERAQYTFA